MRFLAKRAATAGCGGPGRFEFFTMWFDTLVRTLPHIVAKRAVGTLLTLSKFVIL